MPAETINNNGLESGYFHITNKGILENQIFNDNEDCDTFLNYLKDYLTPPDHLNIKKKEFTIKGKIYLGTPHKTKNYFDSLTLIAYSLRQDHFHLLLYRKDSNSMERFMRSLTTRYSIYFNKKYNRKGCVFTGPYKSIYIKDVFSLVHLTKYLHRNYVVCDSIPTTRCCSYQEYIGKRKTTWIKPAVILSFFNQNGNSIENRIQSYKEFVEKYKLTNNETELLEKLILEKYTDHLLKNTKENENKTPYKPTSKEDKSYKNQKESSIFTPIFVSTVSFVVLFSIGFKNVQSYNSNNVTVIYSISSNTLTKGNNRITELYKKLAEKYKDFSNSNSLLSSINSKLLNIDNTTSKDNVSDQSTSTDPSSPLTSPHNQSVAGIYNEITVQMGSVQIGNELEYVNIFASPSFYSRVVGKTTNGDIFEILSSDLDWYEIQLNGGSIGYIQSIYIKEIK